MKNDYPNPATGRHGIVSGKKPLQLILLALLCAGLFPGCAQIRKATYPSDFVYVDQKQVKTEMALFSRYMGQLDQILMDDSTVSSEQQERVMATLSKIEASANTLGADNVRTSHLVIDDHIDQFREDVYTAIKNASADPPNYYGLGRLSGSCVGCHKFR